MPYPSYQPSSRRFIGWGLVVLLHIGLIYALVNGLAERSANTVRPPIEARIIAATPPPQETPPPPPPPPAVTPPPPPFVPPPEVHIATPAPASSSAITATATPPPPAPARAEPVRVLPRLDPSRSRQPEYPLAARRLGREGSLVLQVLVDVDGKVIDAKLVQSSGFDPLDQAALADVKQDYRFVPGTVDGKPQQMWRTIKFVWKLT